MKRYSSLSILAGLTLCMIATSLSCNNADKTARDQSLIETDTAEAKLAVISLYDFINTNDLSDSLTYNQWPSYFTPDILFIQSKGQPPIPFPFKDYRGVFKANKVSYDGLIIDRVEASGDLAYVLYHFHEVVKTIKTNEVWRDVLISAVITLRKNAEGKWRVCIIGYL